LEIAQDESHRDSSLFSSDKNGQLVDSIVSGLTELGLTQCQARVYCAVLKLQRASAGSIAKECSLDRGTAYQRVGELLKMDLLKMELGFPHLYLPRNTEKAVNMLLDKRRYELESKIKIASEISSKVEELKRYLSKSGPSATTSYRLEMNRVQASLEFSKFLRETKGEVLFVGPARSLPILANLFEIFKDDRERGIVWRCITEVNDKNRRDVKILSKICQIRHYPTIPMLMTIFDRRNVVFGATPNYMASSNNEDEPHFVFEDPATADVFVRMFEALWETSEVELSADSRPKDAKIDMVTCRST
jgi:sugar-specific transcriptional regulator TrmB